MKLKKKKIIITLSIFIIASILFVCFVLIPKSINMTNSQIGKTQETGSVGLTENQQQ